jgi:hypothetical protein
MSTKFTLSRLRVFAICGLSLCAQTTGRISGVVVDAQGAAVPNAKVSLYLRGASTPLATAQTSVAGNYFFGGVQPVHYDLEFSAAGFQKQVLRNVKVEAGQELAVQPMTMEVSQVAEVLEISAEAVAIQTTNAEIAATVSNEQLRRLPTLNRSPLSLVFTQAGVVSNGRGNTSINGMRPSFTNVTIEGINVQDNFIRTNAVDFLPNMLQLDQIAEVLVATSNSNASMGNGVSQIAFVVPSGTNEYHGSLIWTNRNNLFSANSWFNNRNGVARPFLNQNQFGGGLRGRIIKDKLFFYGNYEGTRLHQQSTATRTILREQARQGIFTYNDTAGVVRQVNLLGATGQQADPATRRIIERIPGPEFINRADIGDRLNTGGYSFNIRDNRIRDNVTGKIDFIPSTRHSFTGTYLWNKDVDDRPDLSNDYRTVPIVQVRNKVKMLSTSWRWNPVPTFTNEARGGFNSAPGIFYSGEDFGSGIFVLPLVGNPVNTFRDQGRYTDTYNYQNNSNWFLGNHTLQFGVQGQRIDVESFSNFDNLPTWTLGMSTANTNALDAARLPGVRSTDLGTANGLLALHAGFISSALQTFNATSRSSGFVGGASNRRNFRQQNVALYLNDTWKVRRNLTLNLGMRWEYWTPVDEINALALLPVLQNGNAINTLLSNATLDFAGSAVGRPWYNKDWNNFAPNIGLAWQPFGDGRTVLRAGYSINYPNDDLIRAIDNNVATNAGLSQTVTLTNLVGRASSPVAIPAPTFRVPRTFSENNAADPQAAFGMPDPNLRMPYVQQWNFSVQRELFRGVFEVRYVGNRATKQFRAFDYNQVQIGNGFIDDFRRAQRNGELALAANPAGGFNPAYNPNIAGSQPLPFFDRLTNGGLLTNGTVRSLIQTGQAGDLANTYQVNRLNGSVSFYRNPFALGTNMVTNYSNANYNGLQIDYRRTIRSAQIQANYVFSKVLSDTAGDQQTRFEPFLDINNAAIERAPTVFDQRHAFKLNGAYDLPFGQGRFFDIQNGIADRIFGGWGVSGFLTWQNGAPFSVLSARGTLNRAGRSAQNTAVTNLTWDQLGDVVGFRMTGNGPYMVAQSAIGTDGRAVAGDGQRPFDGQVFFNPPAGELGTLQRRMFYGPKFFNIDFAVLKNIPVTERHRFELRGEFFNLTNTPSFFIGDQNINNANFGRITSTASTRRIVQFGLLYRF